MRRKLQLIGGVVGGADSVGKAGAFPGDTVAHGVDRGGSLLLDQLRAAGANSGDHRIGIARALAVEPEFILCDEPISALDVSIQAQIINLLMDLREKKGLTYLMISHDLSMVKHVSDRIIVMYLGKIVETCPAAELYAHPGHPYTQALISAIPIADPAVERKRERIILSGQVPSPTEQITGCPFAGRCRYATDRCRTEQPALREAAPGHFVACHLV